MTNSSKTRRQIAQLEAALRDAKLHGYHDQAEQIAADLDELYNQVQ
jgi:hypothetical protein